MKRAELIIDKLVHGGQGLAHDDVGRAVFVWGALPGEKVEVRYTRIKKEWADAVAEEILTASDIRIIPEEPEAYLSTSPWQICQYEFENLQKSELLKEMFKSSNLKWHDFYAPTERYGYRNKMEYNFWYDTEHNTVSLAMHARGSHNKNSVNGSCLAMPSINTAGKKIIDFLNNHSIGGRQLKSVVMRSDTSGNVEAVLYVTDKDVARLPWQKVQCGVTIAYSNPKSPASVITERLSSFGKGFLEDTVLGTHYRYSPEGFFQVNVKVYEETLRDIQKFVTDDDITDMYAGVGSIGMSLSYRSLISVELDEQSHIQALRNAENHANTTIVHASTENSLEYITADRVLIVDPPRAGLHKNVVAKIVEVKPKKVVYVSCNPATQARDIGELLRVGYSAVFCRGYNYFPATPHIESLIILERKEKNV